MLVTLLFSDRLINKKFQKHELKVPRTGGPRPVQNKIGVCLDEIHTVFNYLIGTAYYTI